MIPSNKRPKYAPPEPFTLLPMLVLLPVEGSISELEKLTSSFYARYEKVQTLKKTLQVAPTDPMQRRLQSEEAMLKQILEWLSVSTAGAS